jgi:hypothetical protein
LATLCESDFIKAYELEPIHYFLGLKRRELFGGNRFTHLAWVLETLVRQSCFTSKHSNAYQRRLDCNWQLIERVIHDAQATHLSNRLKCVLVKFISCEFPFQQEKNAMWLSVSLPRVEAPHYWIQKQVSPKLLSEWRGLHLSINWKLFMDHRHSLEGKYASPTGAQILYPHLIADFQPLLSRYYQLYVKESRFEIEQEIWKQGKIVTQKVQVQRRDGAIPPFDYLREVKEDATRLAVVNHVLFDKDNKVPSSTLLQSLAYLGQHKMQLTDRDWCLSYPILCDILLATSLSLHHRKEAPLRVPVLDFTSVVMGHLFLKTVSLVKEIKSLCNANKEEVDFPPLFNFSLYQQFVQEFRKVGKKEEAASFFTLDQTMPWYKEVVSAFTKLRMYLKTP